MRRARRALDPGAVHDQSFVLPDALAGLDVLAKSPTGSGKTLAFAIPIVERTTSRDKRPSALVLVPTRELAVQVTEALGHRARERPQGRRRLRRHAAPLSSGSRAFRQHPRRDARPPPGPGGSAHARPLGSTHPRPRRGRSHARYGFQAAGRSDRAPPAEKPANDVLLGHARRRGGSSPGPTRAARLASRPICPRTGP